MISVIVAGCFQVFRLQIRDVRRSLQMVNFPVQFRKILVQRKCKNDKYYAFEAVSFSYVNGFIFAKLLFILR